MIGTSALGLTTRAWTPWRLTSTKMAPSGKSTFRGVVSAGQGRRTALKSPRSSPIQIGPCLRRRNGVLPQTRLYLRLGTFVSPDSMLLRSPCRTCL